MDKKYLLNLENLYIKAFYPMSQGTKRVWIMKKTGGNVWIINLFYNERKKSLNKLQKIVRRSVNNSSKLDFVVLMDSTEILAHANISEKSKQYSEWWLNIFYFILDHMF